MSKAMTDAATGETIEPRQFDTTGYPETESRSLCLAMLTEIIGPVEIEDGAEGLGAWRGVQCKLAQLAVMTCFFASRPLLIGSRGVAHSDRALMVRSMEGPLVVRQDGRDIEMPAGDFLFLAADSAYELFLPQGGRLDCGSLPVSALRVQPAGLARILLRPIPKSFPPLQLLITYGAYLLMRGPHGAREADMANVHFNEILPLVVGYLEAAGGIAGSNDRLRSVKMHIDKTLSDATLSVTSLAELHGVTPRYIQKMFQQDGTTFSKYLLERRLAAARALILRPGDERPISSVAYEVGFGDLSYFNKAFRKQFGHAPSDLRKGSRH